MEIVEAPPVSREEIRSVAAYTPDVTPASPPAPPRRLTSLDVFRGVTMLFIIVGIFSGASRGGDAAGTLLRAGVTAAVRISPLIAIGSAGWVMLVRRFDPAVRLPTGEATRGDRPPG